MPSVSTAATTLPVGQEVQLGTVASNSVSLSLNCTATTGTVPAFTNLGTSDFITVRMYRQDGTLFFTGGCGPQPSTAATAFFGAYDSVASSLRITATMSSSTAASCGIGVTL